MFANTKLFCFGKIVILILIHLMGFALIHRVTAPTKMLSEGLKNF